MSRQLSGNKTMEFSKILKKYQLKEPVKAPLKPEVLRPVVLPEAEEPRENANKEEVDQEPIIKPIRPLFVQQRAAIQQEAGREAAHAQYAPSSHPIDTAVAQTSFEDTAPLYERMVDTAKTLFRKDIVYEDIDTSQIVNTITEAASAVSAGDEKLIELAITYIMKDGDSYLYQHSVNVCVISIAMGFGLNYEIGKLIELGLAAFLHDIGMAGFEDMVKVPRKLSQKEYDEIKKHVEAGDQILKKINHGLSDTIITVQYEIHERLDGSGYPLGKKIIHDYAKIIALADAFESMIHSRPFRPNYSIMEVYKRIFDAKNKYDQKVIKALVDKIGFFPNGSYVELNTKEIGRVIRQSPRSPLRPMVRIVYGVDGERLDESKVKEANLLKFPTIHVKKCFLENSEKGEPANE
ncbi:MAG: HD domain-containing phosphohydrolase [Candidatus Omnitrophota bacterium]